MAASLTRRLPAKARCDSTRWEVMASKTKKDKEGPWQTPQRAFVEVNDGVDDTVHDAVKQVPGTMNHSIALLRNRVNLSLKSADVLRSTDVAILSSATKLLRLGKLLDDANVPVCNRLAPQQAARTRRTTAPAPHPRQHASGHVPPARTSCQRGNVRAANAEWSSAGEREREEERMRCPCAASQCSHPCARPRVFAANPKPPARRRLQPTRARTREPGRRGVGGGDAAPAAARLPSRRHTASGHECAPPRRQRRQEAPLRAHAPGRAPTPPLAHMPNCMFFPERMQQTPLEPRGVPRRKTHSEAQATPLARAPLACLQVAGARETPVHGAC